MSVTVDLDDALLRAARKRAAERGETLTALIEEAPCALLATLPPAAERFRLRWEAHKEPLLPGGNPPVRDSLHDAMAGRR